MSSGNPLGIFADSSVFALHVLAILLYFLPYFMIPFLIKVSSGLLGRFYDAVEGRTRGARHGLNGLRDKVTAPGRERRSRWVLNKRAQATSWLQGQASVAQRRGRRGIGRVMPRGALRGLAGVVGGDNIAAQVSARQAAANKEVDDQQRTGDDTGILAMWADMDDSRIDPKTGARQYRSMLGGENWYNEADVLASRARWGIDSYHQQASLSYVMGKAAENEEVQRVANNFERIADQIGLNGPRREQAWMGAAFGVQDKHLEYKRMKATAGKRQLRSDDGSRDKFLTELYEKRGAYNVAQMGANTINEIVRGYDEDTQLSGDMTLTPQQRTEAGERATKAKAVINTFMTQLSSGGGGQPGQQQVQPGVSVSRQASTPGAAHTAEAIYQAATHMDLYDSEPGNPQR